MNVLLITVAALAITTQPGLAEVSGNIVRYTGAHEVVITATDTSYTLDDVVVIKPGAGCAYFSPDHTAVRCARGSVKRIAVRAGNGDDRVVNATDTPSTLDGRVGDDVLVGGSAGDELKGGPGDDVLVGGPGVDTLHGGPGHNTCVGGEVRKRC